MLRRHREEPDPRRARPPPGGDAARRPRDRGFPMTTDLRDLLELASADVPEVDLAQGAWDAAAAERRTAPPRCVPVRRRRRRPRHRGGARPAERPVGPRPGPRRRPRACRPRRSAGSPSRWRPSRVPRPCSRPTGMPPRSPSASGSGSGTPRTSCSSDQASAWRERHLGACVLPRGRPGRRGGAGAAHLAADRRGPLPPVPRPAGAGRP